MIEEQGETFVEEDRPLTQNSYSETPYEDSAWEIVGEILEELDFTPMSFQVVGVVETLTDPMFADYGGFEADASPTRYHLPQGIGYYPSQEEKKLEEAQVQGLSISDQELEQRLQEAFQNGQAEAEARCNEEMAKKVSDLEGRFSGVLQDLLKQVRLEISRIERESLSLSLRISEKLIGHAVEINPEYIAPIIQEAISLAGAATITKVRVSPQDMEAIRVLGLAKGLQEEDAQWSFEEDALIRSGCVVETSAGEIDHQLDQAWERIKDTILKVAR